MDYRFLSQTRLFKGASPLEVEAMLHCLNAYPASFQKGERILRMGSSTTKMGLMLSGSVVVESVDAWGNVTLMGKKGPGQVFGEAYACSPGTPLRVDVVADGPCEVLMLEIARVVATCSSACSHHQLLLVNLMGILAKQSLELSKRSTITAPKTIRGRMLAFLSAEALEQGSRSLSIKMNRNQLASYLGVDRSALSAELGKMQRDGLIEVDRNHFSLSDEVS